MLMMLLIGIGILVFPFLFLDYLFAEDYYALILFFYLNIFKKEIKVYFGPHSGFLLIVIIISKVEYLTVQCQRFNVQIRAYCAMCHATSHKSCLPQSFVIGWDRSSN
ncbi:unnamed protein product [Rhizophagus irregularis]|nr:unnamed protein product [Rhizophagus irregularis]